MTRRRSYVASIVALIAAAVALAGCTPWWPTTGRNYDSGDTYDFGNGYHIVVPADWHGLVELDEPAPQEVAPAAGMPIKMLGPFPKETIVARESAADLAVTLQRSRELMSLSSTGTAYARTTSCDGAKADLVVDELERGTDKRLVTIILWGPTDGLWVQASDNRDVDKAVASGISDERLVKLVLDEIGLVRGAP